jgi:hypothetical protein
MHTKKRKTELKEKIKSKKQAFALEEMFEKKNGYQTLTDFVVMLKTPHFDQAIPAPCLCKNKEGKGRVAFAEDTDQHKVEAALYNFAFSFPIADEKEMNIKSIPIKTVQGQNVYGDYGDCGFCHIMIWLLYFLPRLYQQRMEEQEKVKQEPELKKKKLFASKKIKEEK